MLQPAPRVVQPKQQRPHRRPLSILMPPEARDHAVAVALMLHLQHRPLVRLIPARSRLRHHPVQPRALEPPEPILRHLPVARGRCLVNRRLGPLEHLRQPSRPFRERPLPQILIAQAKQIEEHHRRRRLLRQQPHPRRRRMHPQLQRIEVQPALRRNHDLPVQHAPRRQLLQQRGLDIREVPVQRLAVPALDQDLPAIAKHHRPKPIPLRLEDPPLADRNLGYTLRQHRQHRRIDRKLHRTLLQATKPRSRNSYFPANPKSTFAVPFAATVTFFVVSPSFSCTAPIT